MRIISSCVRTLILAGFVASSLFSSAAEKSPWLEVHSAHFTVVTDAGEKKGREVALRFEQMRAVFGSLLTKDRLSLSLPLTIVAFANDKNYYQVAPLVQGRPIAASGFFVAGDDQNFIVLNLFETESWRAVAHDFAHMYLNYNYPPAQGWFDEGLAEYFASIRVDNKTVEMGGDPELSPSVTQDMLQQQVETNPPQSLTELLGAQTWMSISDLFSMKHDTTRGEGTHHTLFYAQSWMVMHYLIHEKKLQDVGTYFGLTLNQHIPTDEAIQQAFGMSSAQLEQAVKTYFRSLTALQNALTVARQQNPDPTVVLNTPQPYQFPALIDPDNTAITMKPVSEADARALYAGIQTRIPERRDVGLKDLQALATTPTPAQAAAPAKAAKKEKNDDEKLPDLTIGNEVAHRFLAWDHIQKNEFDDAATELGDAAALDQRDMWIRYYLCVLKHRMAQVKKAEISGLPNMMQDLRVVLEWYPEFANAYDLMAVARTEGGGPTAAMQAERAAMQLSPRDERYVFHQAQIYITGKQWEAATALLTRLKVSSNPEIAAQSKEKLDQIATERKFGIPAASGATAPKLAEQKSPFDVLAQDAAAREAAEKASQNGGTADTRTSKFFRGRLVKVDCSQAPAAMLTVTANGVVLKLRAADYKSLVLIGEDDFSCDWRDRQVTVNYKPGGTSDGDLVSVEIR